MSWTLTTFTVTCEAAPLQIEGEIVNKDTGEVSTFYFRARHRTVRLSVPDYESLKGIIVGINEIGTIHEWSAIDLNEGVNLINALLPLLPESLERI